MKAIKEILIMVSLLAIVVFAIGIVLYDNMPNNKTVPEPVTYAADPTTTALIQEISSQYVEGNEANEEIESILKSYSIGLKDLSTAASKKSYTSGKTDPFAEYVEQAGNTVTDPNTTLGGTNTLFTDTNSVGTFFEKPSSK